MYDMQYGDSYCIVGGTVARKKREGVRALVYMRHCHYIVPVKKASLVIGVWHVAVHAEVNIPAAVVLVHTGLPRSMQTHITHHTPELPLLQGASQVLQDYFAKDSQVIPDIGELLDIRRSVQPRAHDRYLTPLASWCTFFSLLLRVSR
jgi:hypothetical protein